MENKFCNKCNELKLLSDFYKNKSKKSGYYSICKKCVIQWRTENKDKISKKKYPQNKEQRKLHYELNKDDILIQRKKYYELNKDDILSQKKEYYYKNIEDRKKYLKEYRNSYILWNSLYKKEISSYIEIRQNEEFLEVKCTYCGKWYKPTNSKISNTIRVMNGTSAGGGKLYCSDNCKKECPIFYQKKWPKGFKINSSREVQPELRQLVLERDNYTCQKCFKPQDELKVGLHCHHKEGININPIESADMDMCITYCKNCHKEVHKIEGCKYSDMKC